MSESQSVGWLNNAGKKSAILCAAHDKVRGRVIQLGETAVCHQFVLQFREAFRGSEDNSSYKITNYSRQSAC